MKLKEMGRQHGNMRQGEGREAGLLTRREKSGEGWLGE